MPYTLECLSNDATYFSPSHCYHSRYSHAEIEGARSTRPKPRTYTIQAVRQRYKFLVLAFNCRCVPTAPLRLSPVQLITSSSAPSRTCPRRAAAERPLLSPPPLCSPRYLNTIPNLLCSPLPHRPGFSRPAPSLINRSRAAPLRGRFTSTFPPRNVPAPSYAE